MTRQLRLIGIFLILLGCFSSFAGAQSNATDAALDGYINDPSSSWIASANVTLRDVDTDVSAHTVSDNNGYYRFPLVPVGHYELTIQSEGFATYTQKGISVTVGQKARLDVTLQLGSANQTVEVTSATPMTDTGDAAISAVLDEKQVEDLPLASRNVYNYHLLAPGVMGVPSNTFSTTYFSFGGNERSQWNLDGLDDSEHGGNRQIRMVIVTPEAVQETQVLSSGYSAEFGRAAGGQINVVTKSGTNEFHGSGLVSGRFSRLQAMPSLATIRTPRSWEDGAGTLSGPIIKDKMFFFGQFEDNPYTLPIPITISASNAAALGLPASQLGNTPFSETYRTLMGKVTYNLDDKNSGYLRYNRATNHQPNDVGGLDIPNVGMQFNDHMNGGGAQLATILSPNLLNELRIGVIQRDTQYSPAGTPMGVDADVYIAGVGIIGYNPYIGSTSTERSTEVVDNMTWTHGHSTVKFGTDLEHTTFDIYSSLTREYIFSSLAQYQATLAGKSTYLEFLETNGNPKLNIGFTSVNGFVQDEFRITPSLSVNAGIRYEALLFPELDRSAPYALSRSVNNDYSDFAPRVSFTWAPFHAQTTVLRGAFGMYYDIPGLSTFYDAAQLNGDRLLSYTIVGGEAGAPTYPSVPNLSGPGYETPSNITAFDPQFHNAYQQQATLQLEHQLPTGTLLTLGYDFAGMRHGLYEVDTNLGAPTGTLADGRPIYGGPRPNTEFGQINLIRSGTTSSFNGMFVSLRQRPFHGFQASVNYMYSHAIADGLGEGAAPEDPSNLNRDRGNADDDQRHSLTLQGIYEPHADASWLKWVNGFEFTSMTFYSSGFPIDPLTGTDLNKDTETNDRPLFMGRNSIAGPSTMQEDAQLQRNFTFRERYHGSIFIETENLLNSTNAACDTTTGCSSAVNNDWGTGTTPLATFGQIISARTSRNVQTGLKFSF
jgi:hypothetical protein